MIRHRLFARREPVARDVTPRKGEKFVKVRCAGAGYVFRVEETRKVRKHADVGRRVVEQGVGCGALKLVSGGTRFRLRTTTDGMYSAMQASMPDKASTPCSCFAFSLVNLSRAI
jgi:hypothetical protein